MESKKKIETNVLCQGDLTLFNECDILITRDKIDNKNERMSNVLREVGKGGCPSISNSYPLEHPQRISMDRIPTWRVRLPSPPSRCREN
jgi:hypothetical protein